MPDIVVKTETPLQPELRRSSFPLIESAFTEISDAVRDFAIFSEIGPVVSVFGSARFKEDHPQYISARNFAARLSGLDCVLLTGGGPGIMEATNRGAHEYGGVSFSCSIRLPREQKTNVYSDLDKVFEYFFTRKIFLMKGSNYIVAYPGGYGTQDETLEAFNLINKGKMHPVPIILVGKDYWEPHINFLIQHAEPIGAIKSSDFLVKGKPLFHMVDDDKQAFDIIQADLQAKAKSPNHENVKPKLHISEKMFMRAWSEFSSALQTLSNEPPHISVSGANTLATGRYVKMAYEFGKAFGKQGLNTLVSDLNPTTEFLNTAVRTHGGVTMGFVNPEYRPDKTNDVNLMVKLPVYYQFIREVLSHKCSSATVLFPGGFGTLKRANELVTLMQTKKAESKPVIAVGSEYWKPLREIAKKIYLDKYNAINEDDLDILQIVDTSAEALDIINSSRK
jgi:uncharacterized protein (TIGR00730 family)